MGRALMYTALGALFLLVISSVFILKHGGDNIAAIERVDLHNLTTVNRSSFYIGRTISTQGTLQFDAGRNEYVLIDNTGQGQNFPLVVRPIGGQRLGALAGQDVTVTGIFGTEAVTGPFIKQARVDPTSALPTSATATPGGI